jgi:hypothetical protein
MIFGGDVVHTRPTCSCRRAVFHPGERCVLPPPPHWRSPRAERRQRHLRVCSPPRADHLRGRSHHCGWYLAPQCFSRSSSCTPPDKPIHLEAVTTTRLIAADRWLFGVDPTVWLCRFATPCSRKCDDCLHAVLSSLPDHRLRFYRRGERAAFRILFTCVYDSSIYLRYTLPRSASVYAARFPGTRPRTAVSG